MNDTRKRSLAKSIVWRLVCIAASVITVYILTQKWDIAAAVGTIYNATVNAS